MSDAPDLRTAAQAINEIIQREWPVVDFRGRQDELEALRAALAAATEPPPPIPCDECETTGQNCRAHRSRPVYEQAGSAPNPQGEAESFARIDRLIDQDRPDWHAAAVGAPDEPSPVPGETAPAPTPDSGGDVPVAVERGHDHVPALQPLGVEVDAAGGGDVGLGDDLAERCGSHTCLCEAVTRGVSDEPGDDDLAAENRKLREALAVEALTDAVMALLSEPAPPNEGPDS